YLTDHVTRLRPPVATPPKLEGRVKAVRDYLATQGASFFAAIREGTGAGFPTETVDALWELVWMGLVTNDTLHPLRGYTSASESRRTRRPSPARFRSRRSSPRTSEGRWSLVETVAATPATATEWGAATAHQLLTRYGVVTREPVSSEAIAGGFSAVYQVLRAMEDAGRIRRGYFVAAADPASVFHGAEHLVDRAEPARDRLRRDRLARHHAVAGQQLMRGGGAPFGGGGRRGRHRLHQRPPPLRRAGRAAARAEARRRRPAGAPA